MGRLIIDGNSVFEIDEECMKRRRAPLNCDVEKYFKDEPFSSIDKIENHKNIKISKKTVE